jgi:hypothetical protein
MYRLLAMTPTYYGEQLPDHVRGNAMIDKFCKSVVSETFCEGVAKFSPLNLISLREKLKVQSC